MNSVYRLMRLDKPIGILLLWWPTAWALWTANHTFPPTPILIWFFLGTVLMRSAGCVMNDIADRNIDLHVQRTKSRPLTSGEMSLVTAFGILGMLLLLALIVLLQLPHECFYYALAAVVLAMLYPFCKRFFPTPQGVLALAFSMGIPMAYASLGAKPNVQMVILLLINILWVLAYDTIYALLDRADDERIGVHSTARYWEKYDRQVIIGLQVTIQLLWLVWAYLSGVNVWFYLVWIVGSVNFLIQQFYINQSMPEKYFQAFKLNGWYGFWMWLGLTF